MSRCAARPRIVSLAIALGFDVNKPHPETSSAGGPAGVGGDSRDAAGWPGRLAAAIGRVEPLMIRVRRHLHMHPEVSGRETGTAAYLADRLREAGLEPRLVAGGCGLIVDSPVGNGAGGGAARGRVALRADTDALPIGDAKDAAYRSQTPGVMHACGHDAHAAAVVGAAIALHRMAAAGELPALVAWRAIFQPAEETNTGALAMIEAGAVEGVAAIFGLHMDPSRRAGEIGVRAGAFTADCDEMSIRVSGRGGHASRPHESLDPIAAAAQLVNALYVFLPRGGQSHEPVVVTVAKIAGGESYNVIPDHVEMLGTVRCFDAAVRSRTHDHVRRLAHGVAATTGTTIEVGFHAGPPSVLNDVSLTEIVREAAAEAIGGDAVKPIERASLGGEDFAHYLRHVPGCMFRCGCAATEGAPPLHSPRFDIDEAALTVGAKVLVNAAVQWSRSR